MKNKFNLTTVSLLLAAFTATPSFADGDKHFETVYTLTNSASQNEVLAFQRNKSGNMEAAGRFATGGTGTGSGLGNQGALALSDNERYLFAINAGSNDVSVFRINRNSLELIDHAAQPGIRPVSVAVSRNLVYVVNAGDDSIFGYQFNPVTGKLQALPNSHSRLSATGTGPAQISFDKDADHLVVTEKATNKITTFSLNENGIPFDRHVINSAGTTPFGFAFGKRNQFFVSEAQGGAANKASVSSYKLMEDGAVNLIDAAVPANQAAACWLVTTPNGRLGFITNTASNAISSYAIDPAGHLSLLQSKAAEEIRPTDLVMDHEGSMLYSLSGGSNSIGVYRVNKSGALNKLDTINALPAGVTGLIVRENDGKEGDDK